MVNVRLFIIGLILLLGVLQYKLWLSSKGIPRFWEMEQSIVEQTKMVEQLENCNRELRAEVIDLKSGKEALEERARSDLGMIKPGEVFISSVTYSDNHNETVAHDVAVEEIGQCEKISR